MGIFSRRLRRWFSELRAPLKALHCKNLQSGIYGFVRKTEPSLLIIVQFRSDSKKKPQKFPRRAYMEVNVCYIACIST